MDTSTIIDCARSETTSAPLSASEITDQTQRQTARQQHQQARAMADAKRQSDIAHLHALVTSNGAVDASHIAALARLTGLEGF